MKNFSNPNTPKTKSQRISSGEDDRSENRSSLDDELFSRGRGDSSLDSGGFNSDS